jgi:hypothetical protein
MIYQNIPHLPDCSHLCAAFCVNSQPDYTQFVRRDPAVLSALPEVQALIRQAVEACADEISDRADFVEDSIKWGGSKQYLTSLKGGLIELRNIAAAIRKRGEG